MSATFTSLPFLIVGWSVKSSSFNASNSLSFLGFSWVCLGCILEKTPKRSSLLFEGTVFPISFTVGSSWKRISSKFILLTLYGSALFFDSWNFNSFSKLIKFVFSFGTCTWCTSKYYLKFTTFLPTMRIEFLCVFWIIWCVHTISI